ncbi:MAG: hypothetical protein QF609_12670, partial [Gammaproteobacteria bacterium]|nr:hypothetical protein [Gammaproteobacteria bacterium]
CERNVLRSRENGFRGQRRRVDGEVDKTPLKKPQKKKKQQSQPEQESDWNREPFQSEFPDAAQVEGPLALRARTAGSGLGASRNSGQ